METLNLTPTDNAPDNLKRLADIDDDSDNPKVKKQGRRKINIEYIKDKSRRHITFSKRKHGIMKKAYELSTLTGTQVLLLVVSETGLVYTFTTPKLQPIVTKAEGKALIQSCLNTPEPEGEAPRTNAFPEELQASLPVPEPETNSISPSSLHGWPYLTPLSSMNPLTNEYQQQLMQTYWSQPSSPTKNPE